jgi:hypothetical protein
MSGCGCLPRIGLPVATGSLRCKPGIQPFIVNAFGRAVVAHADLHHLPSDAQQAAVHLVVCVPVALVAGHQSSADGGALAIGQPQRPEHAPF